MGKDDTMAVKDAVHKLQFCLLEGIQNERQLFAAGSLMSGNDYQDVVTERTIADMCGYPLCSNPLPLDRPNKGHYRISLKEHKVYDLQKTYLYCSTRCAVNSQAFAGSLPDERGSVLNPTRLSEIMMLFEGSGQDSKGDLRKNGDLGLSTLKIQEKSDINSGEVSFEDWIGPSNAIEGYTPLRETGSKPQHSKSKKGGSNSKSKHTQPNKEKHITFSEMDFTSDIITQDEYTIPKSPGATKTRSSKKSKDAKDQTTTELAMSAGSLVESKPDIPDKLNREFVKVDDLRFSDLSLASSHTSEAEGRVHVEKPSGANAALLKSSLKTSDSKKATRAVTWADEKSDVNGSKSLCEYREAHDKTRATVRRGPTPIEDDYNSHQLASAESCAQALSQAAEAVASGEYDVHDAVSEAGLIVLPPSQEIGYGSPEENDDNVISPGRVPSKWPKKPGSLDFDLFDSKDSWYDRSPEGVNLALSPFATMFMSLFAWMSSSSSAYIYGRDDSCYEEYLSVNGREYPCRVVMADGRSSEIKETLVGCLARALPGVVAGLRLPTPISILEQGMAHVLETMSFIDPLPPFRMKQWQVIVLLFLDALSVCRIPALAPYMTGRRVLLHKVLEGAQVSSEEYEILKDLIIPLGRVPQFSSQIGG